MYIHFFGSKSFLIKVKKSKLTIIIKIVVIKISLLKTILYHFESHSIQVFRVCLLLKYFNLFITKMLKRMIIIT